MALWNRILFPVSNIWDRDSLDNGGQKDPTSFTAQGGTYKPGDLAIEGIDKSQDSLTQFMRSITNLTGQTGKDFLAKGDATFTQGRGTTQQGKDTIGPALDFWMKLLSGDPAAQANAIAPTARTIVSQYDAAKKAALTTAPRGGARSGVLAEMPFKKAGDIGTLIQQLQPKAAGEVSDIGKFLSQLGITESGLGLTQSGLGLQSLAATLQGLLGRRGQNIQENATTMQMLAGFGEAIGKIVSMGMAGGGGGKSGGN
jgi:hypothetical protein